MKNQNNSDDMTRSDERVQKEFIKDDKATMDDLTKMQQRGGEKTVKPRLFKKQPKEHEEKEREYECSAEKDEIKDSEKEAEKEIEKKQPEEIYNPKDMRPERLAAARAGMEHDMRDQTLGQIYKINGANVDYDEIQKMSRNGIRDSAEAAQESLANDGFTENVETVQKAMEGFIKQGKPDINELVKLDETFDKLTIVQAYSNVVKQASIRDVGKIERISEAFDFEHPAYDKAFDMIRSSDKEADSALDRMDMEMGIERE